MEGSMVIDTSRHVFQHLYARLLLTYMGKGIQSACLVDPKLAREVEELPIGTVISVILGPSGPAMVLQKSDLKKLVYLGNSFSKRFPAPGLPSTVIIRIRSFAEGMAILSCSESPTTALARGRIFVEGSVSIACRFLRILNFSSIYLFSRKISCKIMKRFEKNPFLFFRKPCILLLTIVLQRGIVHGN